MVGRYYFGQLLNECIAQGKQLDFDKAFPEIFRKGIVYTNLKRSQFPDPFLNLQNKAVDKLQLHCHIKERVITDAYLFIRYRNQQTAYFQISSGQGQELTKIFTSFGSTEESIFYRAGIKALDWQRQPQRAIYAITELVSTKNQKPALFYQRLHQLISDRILKLLNAYPSRPVNIIDAGCGNGIFLKYLEHQVKTTCPHELTRIKMTGFDFNAANILDCRQKYHGSCHFFSGNLLTIDSTLETLKSTSHVFSQEKSINILVLSGTLTRLVLPDTYQGLQALSAIARAKEFHFIIGGGLAEPMINSYLAKQHGYESLLTSNKTKNAFFCFAKSPRANVIAAKLAKMKNKNLLDLSFCQDATLLNILSRHVKPNMTIDLSYCHYNKEMEIALKMLINMQPQVKLVVQHYDSVILRAFDHHFNETGCITTLSFDPQQSELPLFGAYRRKARQNSLFSPPKSASDQTAKSEPQQAVLGLNSRL